MRILIAVVREAGAKSSRQSTESRSVRHQRIEFVLSFMKVRAHFYNRLLNDGDGTPRVGERFVNTLVLQHRPGGAVSWWRRGGRLKRWALVGPARGQHSALISDTQFFRQYKNKMMFPVPSCFQ